MGANSWKRSRRIIAFLPVGIAHDTSTDIWTQAAITVGANVRPDFLRCASVDLCECADEPVRQGSREFARKTIGVIRLGLRRCEAIAVRALEHMIDRERAGGDQR